MITITIIIKEHKKNTLFKWKRERLDATEREVIASNAILDCMKALVRFTGKWLKSS